MRTELDDIDRQILECYREDPGLSAAAIGRKASLSETAIRERTKKLLESGVLSFAVAID